MVSLAKLQDEILNNPSHIETVLYKLGHEEIKDRGSYYQTSNLDGDNKTAISIKKDTLQYQNFTRGKSGNLITLVEDEKHCEFRRALELVAGWIGLQDASYQKIKLPFSGFYKNIEHDDADEEIILPEYEEIELPPCGLSKMFLDDGVDLLTQEYFNMRFDLANNNICIPIYDLYGRLVGCKARNNDKNCPLDKRWFATLPFSKTKVVYGMNYNYDRISNKRKCIVVEAEKSVQIMKSFGVGIGVSVMGHKISKQQELLIKSLNCDEIIVGFDADIDEEEVRFESSKLLVDNKFYKNKVKYIYGGLPNNSKASPVDYGKDLFKDLLRYNLNTIR